MVRIDKGLSSQFAEKRKTWKIVIYVLNITLKQDYFLAEIPENQDVPILESFKSQNRDCPDKMGTFDRYGSPLIRSPMVELTR